MILRPYQRAALDTLWRYLHACDGNPAIVLPTGAGKSPLMAAIMREAVEGWGGRVACVAHTKELTLQNRDKLSQYWPAAPAGVYSASLRRRDRFDPILFLQIQSAYKRAAEFGPFDLILIDEGHRIPLRDEGTYRQFIRDAQALNKSVRVVVLTATPYRLQGRAVPICGPEHIATEIIYEARIPDLIEQGYLTRLISRAPDRPDLAGVHLRGGEYIEAELASVMESPALVKRTVADLLARTDGRKAGIVFCVRVSHALAVLAELVAAGQAAVAIHAGTPATERDDAIAAFQSGALRWMVNVNVLAEGFDAPHIDVVAMLRPTKSPGLMYQQIGRGLRIAPGKVDCLVLDYSGNLLEHGAIDEIRVQRARPGKAAQVQTGTVKECPACGAIVAMQARICECGHSWVSLDPTHLDRPVNAAVLSTDRERVITTHPVRSVKYERHEKPGKPPSLRVTYHCGLRRFSEWVCLEHSGFAHSRAIQWWMDRSHARDVPRTVEEALPLAYGLAMPQEIDVDETDKYARVIACRFGAIATPAAADTPEWIKGIAA